MVDPAVWAGWEAGVAARVALLEEVAADVYGPQRLVARGLLPPELVWGDANLVRTARGHVPIGGRWLVHAAVDVGVDVEGRAVALRDDTATFAGLGHAHENRLTSADLLPGLFARAQVQRLVPFLDLLRARLADLAPPGPGPARVVILSPPRSDPAQDDAAYLARTLGYTLAEGPDLTVRKGVVHLRSLSGLEPVRVVLRLLGDLDSDPLDLDPASSTGTTGLVAANHRGTVALANPVGAGWLMNPALGAFLPAIGRALRGDDAVLAGPAAWWCGEDDGWRRTSAQLSQLVLVPVGGGGAVDGRRLDAEGLGELRARVEAEPRRWVATLPPVLAAAPAHAGGTGPGGPAAVTRLFALALHDDVAIAPGGLTRLVEGGGGTATPGPSGQRTGSQGTGSEGTDGEPAGGQGVDPAIGALRGPTLDTWVLDVGAGRGQPLRIVGLEQVDFADSLPSRAGESLYWVGRYAERAEAVARLAEVVAATGEDLDGHHRASGWPGLLMDALGELTGDGIRNREAEAAGGGAAVPQTAGPPPQVARQAARQAAARALTDRTLPRGLSRAVSGLVTSASAVRELLSPELFRAIGAAADHCPATVAPAPVGPRRRTSDGSGALEGDVRDDIQRLLGDLAAVAGLAQETMVRGPGWYLLDAGRRIERALALLDVLGRALRQRRVDELEAGLLEALLAQAASLIAYRRRYRSDPELSAVLDLLLIDGGNPRSLRFQLDALAHDLAQLPDGGRSTARGALAGAAGQLAARVGRLQPAVLARPGPRGRPTSWSTSWPPPGERWWTWPRPSTWSTSPR